MARLFGTDGVRGIANLELTPELAFDLGKAGATVLSQERNERPVFVVGMDTRRSGVSSRFAIPLTPSVPNNLAICNPQFIIFIFI